MISAGTAVYLAGLALAEALRVPPRIARRGSPSARRQSRRGALGPDGAVVLAIALGIWILPLVHVLTRWLQRFDYACPAWSVWAASAVFGAGLVIRWCAQRTLGRHWSPTPGVRDGQALVRTGIYGQIRHPIYASLVLWAAAQPFLLQNVVAGWAGAAAVALIWLVRVPREEAMLLDAFGSEYGQYAARTGRLLPRRRG